MSKKIFSTKTVYKGEFGNYVTEWNQESILLSILAQFQGFGFQPEIEPVGKEGFRLTLNDNGDFNGTGSASKIAQEKEILDKLRFNFHVKNIEKSSAHVFNEDSLKESSIVGDHPEQHDDWEYKNIGGMETPQQERHIGEDEDLRCPECHQEDFLMDEYPKVTCKGCGSRFIMKDASKKAVLTFCSSCGSEDLEDLGYDPATEQVQMRCGSCQDEEWIHV